MTIKTEIDTAAENVGAANDAYVIQHLRRRYPSRRSWRVDIGLVDTVKVKGRDIGPSGIGFALREQETKTSVSHRQLVDDTRRQDLSVADREIRRAAEDFTQGWIVRIELRSAIQRIALEGVVVRPQIARKHAVIGIEIVIDANIDRGTPHGSRRTPCESCGVQT